MLCYEDAEDILALVRTCVFSGDTSRAEDIIQKSRHAGAAFYLGRKYEAEEAIQEAIRCFSIAGRYHHGARLARQYEMNEELMNLALLCNSNVMVETADYFQAKGEWDKAVMLYHKVKGVFCAVFMMKNDDDDDEDNWNA